MNKNPESEPTKLRRNAVFLKNISEEIMEKAQKLEEETVAKTCPRTENGLHQWDQDELGADNEDLGLNCTGLWCSECEALISQETYQKFFSIEATTGMTILDIPIVEPGATKEDIDKAYEKMGLSDSDREQEMEEDNRKEDLEEEKEEIVKCDNGHKCQYESCRAGGGYYCPICDRDEDDPKICVQCWTEFEREVTDHTTLSHLKTYLSDTIESYKREDYNHGKSAFRDEIEEDIKRLEKEIAIERSNEEVAKKMEEQK